MGTMLPALPSSGAWVWDSVTSVNEDATVTHFLTRLPLFLLDNEPPSPGAGAGRGSCLCPQGLLLDPAAVNKCSVKVSSTRSQATLSARNDASKGQWGNLSHCALGVAGRFISGD